MRIKDYLQKLREIRDGGGLAKKNNLETFNCIVDKVLKFKETIIQKFNSSINREQDILDNQVSKLSIMHLALESDAVLRYMKKDSVMLLIDDSLEKQIDYIQFNFGGKTETKTFYSIKRSLEACKLIAIS